MRVNHTISSGYSHLNNLPINNREHLPVVLVRPLPESVDPSRTRQKKACVADSSDQKCLKSLEQNPQELLPSNIIDLDHFRSLFLFPLNYLRGTLITAYHWVQGLLSVEEKPPFKVDLYV
jgi:hypothetical protein